MLLEGIIFILLTTTGLRQKIVNAIPLVMHRAISSGIGLFIAFVGLKGTEDQTTNILNSNSPDSTYLMAKLNEDNTLTVLNININEGHKIKIDINLKFDSHGNLIPFNGKESASHSHKWIERPDGKMARRPASNGENTHLPIPYEYKPLSDAIVKFNIQKHKYTQLIK